MLYQPKTFLFVHIQKTAGISIAKTLHRTFPDTRKIGGRHARIIDQWDDLPTDVTHPDGSVFRFAFVRNPWDRLVSWYAMIEKNRRQNAWLPWRRPQIWDQALNNSSDFKSFVLNCKETIDDRGTLKSFAFDQVSYIERPDGELAVDFVGRFEDLNADLSHVWERLGVPDLQIPHTNATPKRRDFRQYYDDETAQVVAERFKRDIERFGYRFELEAVE